MIICSAVKFTKDDKEFIIMGRRHHNCFETAYDAGVRRPWADVQGFVTDKFEFLDRYEAAKHAFINFQIKDEDMPTRELYSEDLW